MRCTVSRMNASGSLALDSPLASCCAPSSCRRLMPSGSASLAREASMASRVFCRHSSELRAAAVWPACAFICAFACGVAVALAVSGLRSCATGVSVVSVAAGASSVSGWARCSCLLGSTGGVTSAEGSAAAEVSWTGAAGSDAADSGAAGSDAAGAAVSICACMRSCAVRLASSICWPLSISACACVRAASSSAGSMPASL